VSRRHVDWGSQLVAGMSKEQRARLFNAALARDPADAPVDAPPEKKQRCGRQMNKTERRYATRLEAARQLGQVKRAVFEGVTLRIADRRRFTPDFFVVHAEADAAGRILGFDEVKGSYAREDAMVKLEVAARMFPEFRFRLARYERGRWTVTEVRG
jgi:hypothetical protein